MLGSKSNFFKKIIIMLEMEEPIYSFSIKQSKDQLILVHWYFFYENVKNEISGYISIVWVGGLERLVLSIL